MTVDTENRRILDDQSDLTRASLEPWWQAQDKLVVQDLSVGQDFIDLLRSEPIEGRVWFLRCVFEDGADFRDCSVHAQGIHFEDSTFNATLRFDNSTFSGGCLLSKVELGDGASFAGCEFTSDAGLSLEVRSAHGLIDLSDMKVGKSLSIQGHYGGDLSVRGTQIAKRASFVMTVAGSTDLSNLTLAPNATLRLFGPRMRERGTRTEYRALQGPVNLDGIQLLGEVIVGSAETPEIRALEPTPPIGRPMRLHTRPRLTIHTGTAATHTYDIDSGADAANLLLHHLPDSTATLERTDDNFTIEITTEPKTITITDTAAHQQRHLHRNPRNTRDLDNTNDIDDILHCRTLNPQHHQ